MERIFSATNSSIILIARLPANAVHRFVLPAHCARAVSVVVPVAGAGRVQTCAILLHDHTCYWKQTGGGLLVSVAETVSGLNQRQ